jgi:hypothetical protein
MISSFELMRKVQYFFRIADEKKPYTLYKIFSIVIDLTGMINREY